MNKAEQVGQSDTHPKDCAELLSFTNSPSAVAPPLLCPPSKLFIRPRLDSAVENVNWENGNYCSPSSTTTHQSCEELLTGPGHLFCDIWIICAIVGSQPERINNSQKAFGLWRCPLVLFLNYDKLFVTVGVCSVMLIQYREKQSLLNSICFIRWPGGLLCFLTLLNCYKGNITHNGFITCFMM